MAVATISNVVTRIVKIGATVTGITTAVENFPTGPWASAQLPVFIAYPTPGSYSRIGTGRYTIARDYILEVFVSVVDEEKQRVDRTVLDDVQPYLQRVATTFLKYPRLELPSNDPPLGPLVIQTTLIGDDGPAFGGWSTVIYAGCRVRLRVVTALNA